MKKSITLTYDGFVYETSRGSSVLCRDGLRNYMNIKQETEIEMVLSSRKPSGDTDYYEARSVPAGVEVRAPEKGQGWVYPGTYFAFDRIVRDFQRASGGELCYICIYAFDD